VASRWNPFFRPDRRGPVRMRGVTEARDGEGCLYRLAAEVARALAAEVARALAADPRTADPHRLVALVRDGTLRHCGGRLADDTTVFAVRRADESAGKGRLQSWGPPLQPQRLRC
jgi:hypothetical protein